MNYIKRMYSMISVLVMALIISVVFGCSGNQSEDSPIVNMESVEGGVLPPGYSFNTPDMPHVSAVIDAGLASSYSYKTQAKQDLPVIDSISIKKDSELKNKIIPQNTSLYDSEIIGLHPVGWWKLDETKGYTVADSSGHGHTGYLSSYLSNDGLGTNGRSGAANLGGTSYHFGTANTGPSNIVLGNPPLPFEQSGVTYQGPYIEIPDGDGDFSLVKGWDNFGVNVQSGGWYNWQPLYYDYGQGPYYSENSGAGWITESVPGLWGQISPYPRIDSDVIASVYWSNNAPTGNGNYYPGTIATRLAANSTHSYYYEAGVELDPNGHVHLVISKTVNGVRAVTSFMWDNTNNIPLNIQGAGTSWTIRMQTYTNSEVDNSTIISAKLWQYGSTEPSNWFSINDNGTNWCALNYFPAGRQCYSGSGPIINGEGIALLSNNISGETDNGVVGFWEFQVQSVGMTVSAWVHSTSDFFGGGGGAMCPGDNIGEYYSYPVSKKDIFYGQEWGIRHYALSDCDLSCGSTGDRRSGYSAYAWNPYPANDINNPNGLGVGQPYYFPGVNVNNNTGSCSDQIGSSAGNQGVYGWHYIVAIYQPGDYNDQTAGVEMYFDGQLMANGKTPTGGANYYWSTGGINGAPIDVAMSQTPTPLRLGATSADQYSWHQFQGDIDDVAIFDHMLSPSDVATLYQYAYR